jgi:CheY-like chemotaxis protein
MVASATSASPAAPAKSVLIVEDERVSRRALTMLLSACGFRTAAVASAEEAIGLIQDGRHPAVAVIDLDLPGMSGLDLIRKITQLDPAIYPVLVTGADCARLDLVLQDQNVTCLRKPVDFPRLLSLLNQPQTHN